MVLQVVVPAVLEISGEVRFMLPHPGYLIQQNQLAPATRNPPGQQPKRLWPGFRHDKLPPGLFRKSFSEVTELVGVSLAFSRPKALNRYESQFLPSGELAEQR